MTSSPETVDTSGLFEATSEDIMGSSTASRDSEDFTPLAHSLSISKAFQIFTPKKPLFFRQIGPLQTRLPRVVTEQWLMSVQIYLSFFFIYYGACNYQFCYTEIDTWGKWLCRTLSLAKFKVFTSCLTLSHSTVYHIPVYHRSAGCSRHRDL